MSTGSTPTPKSGVSGSNAVGSEVLSYCTSCRMDLAHIVVSLKGDKIAKAECKTCQKTHAYRKPKGVTTPAKGGRKKKTSKTPEVSVEAEWERLMKANESAPQKDYSMKSSFRIGDRISHTSFGEGIVGKVIYPNKIEVIFRHDIKVLIHAGAPSAPDAPPA